MRLESKFVHIDAYPKGKKKNNIKMGVHLEGNLSGSRKIGVALILAFLFFFSFYFFHVFPSIIFLLFFIFYHFIFFFFLSLFSFYLFFFFFFFFFFTSISFSYLSLSFFFLLSVAHRSRNIWICGEPYIHKFYSRLDF